VPTFVECPTAVIHRCEDSNAVARTENTYSVYRSAADDTRGRIRLGRCYGETYAGCEAVSNSTPLRINCSGWRDRDRRYRLSIKACSKTDLYFFVRASKCCFQSWKVASANLHWANARYWSVIVRGTGGAFEMVDKVGHPNELRRQLKPRIGVTLTGIAGLVP
jgi:hypothetical protein